MILIEDCILLVIVFLSFNLQDKRVVILFMVLSMVLVLVLKTSSLVVLENWDLAKLDRTFTLIMGIFGIATPKSNLGSCQTLVCPHSPTKLVKGASIVSVVLDHAQEPTELFDTLWWH